MLTTWLGKLCAENVRPSKFSWRQNIHSVKLHSDPIFLGKILVRQILRTAKLARGKVFGCNISKDKIYNDEIDRAGSARKIIILELC